MGLFNLRTGKQVDGPEAVVVSDLDAMVANPVAFRLHGKVHRMRPITVKEFFAVSNALLSLERLKSDDRLTDEQIIDLYFQIIHSVCDSVTKNDIKSMTHAQAGALIQLIVDHVTGRAHVPIPDEQKKN